MNYNFENLKNYALWYYFRYFPSSKKLLEKLNEKSKNKELSLKVFENISHLINDKFSLINIVSITIWLKNKIGSFFSTQPILFFSNFYTLFGNSAKGIFMKF